MAKRPLLDLNTSNMGTIPDGIETYKAHNNKAHPYDLCPFIRGYIFVYSKAYNWNGNMSLPVGMYVLQLKCSAIML